MLVVRSVNLIGADTGIAGKGLFLLSIQSVCGWVELCAGSEWRDVTLLRGEMDFGMRLGRGVRPLVIGMCFGGVGNLSRRSEMVGVVVLVIFCLDCTWFR